MKIWQSGCEHMSSQNQTKGFNQASIETPHRSPDLVVDTVRGMSRLLGNTMSALVLVFALGSSRATAAASSSGMCSAVSCGQVMSKDVLYSDD